MFANTLFDFERSSVPLAKCYSWVSRRVIGSWALECMVSAVSHLLTFRSQSGLSGDCSWSAPVSEQGPSHRAATSPPGEHMGREWCQCWLGTRNCSDSPCCRKVPSEAGPRLPKLLHPRSHSHPFPTRVRWQITWICGNEIWEREWIWLAYI